MRFTCLGQKGMAHFVLPILVVAMVAGIGGLVYLRLSHADSVCISSASYITSGARGRCVKDAQDMLDGVYQHSSTSFQLLVRSRAVAKLDTVGTLASLSPAKGGGNDGEFGPLTLHRVKTYQAWRWGAKSSQVDGKVGIKTWTALCNDAKNTTASAQSARVDAGCPGVTSGGSTSTKSGNTTKTTTPPPSQGKLIALGGSITAGLGVGSPLKSSSDIIAGSDNVIGECKRTTEGFPYLVAQGKHMQLVQVACSGAASANVLNKAQFADQPAQLTQAEPYVKGSTVIMGFMGANDIDWINAQNECLTSANGCAGMDATVKSRSGYPNTPITTLQTLTDNMTQVLKTLHSEGAANIIVDEYYQVTWGTPGCTLPAGRTTTQFQSSGDYAWMNKELAALNGAIVAAANNANVGAKLVVPDFQGHGVCDVDPWVATAVRGNGAAMHPTTAGQAELAKLNESKL